MKPPINENMYERKITRIVDVYGKLAWVSTRHLEDSNRISIPICNSKGLRRSHTQAGQRDHQNSYHRGNIRVIGDTKELWELTPPTS